MKTYNKAAVKAVYDFVKKSSTKEQTKTFEIAPGVKSKVSYWINFDGEDWEYVLDSEEFILSKAMSKLFETLLGHDCLEDFSDIDYSEYIDIGEIRSQFEILARKAGIDDEDHYNFSHDAVLETNWTDFWNELNAPEPEKVEPIRLNSQYSAIINSQYSAIINKSDETVQVGCQTIPISAVRKIIEEFDK